MNRRNFIEKGLLLLTGTSVMYPVAARDLHFRNSKITLRFAVASDGHYGQAGTDFDIYHDQMMGWLRAEHEHQPLSFCMFNGDLVQDDPVLFPAVKSKYDSLGIPYYVSRGNHDRCNKKTWRKTWGHDLNYSFEQDGNAFVVLDTSNIHGGYVCPDLKRTKRMLNKYYGSKNLFVFMHIPPKRWTNNAINCDRLVGLFSKQKNLRAIFHGHEHDHDGPIIDEGKVYLFDSHIGGNWGTEYRGYRIVEVFDSGQVITYQVNPNTGSKVNENGLN